MELEKDFITSCHDFFKNIKPKIVEVINKSVNTLMHVFLLSQHQGYLKQHKEIAEQHIADVKQLYSEQKERMDTEVKKVQS